MLDMATGLVAWVQGKIDKLFEYFGFYSANYSKLLVYAFLLFVAAKIFKVKLDWKVGKG